MSLVLEGSAATVAAVASAYLSDCSSRCPIKCGGCFGGFSAFPQRKRTKGRLSNREEFERLINFLSAVPIFQKQLPRADLPIVAKALRLQSWAPGEKVIVQGDEGRAFFIIQAGEASVIVTETNGEASVRARLYNGDYFGGHTLTEKRPNVATIVSKGPNPLETLSLSREDFQRLGLDRKLRFPARPAIYDGRHVIDPNRGEDNGTSAPGAAQAAPAEDVSEPIEQEVQFICQAVTDNANIRTRGGCDLEKVRNMARTARRRRIPAGEDLLRGGELAHDFFVVSKGVLEVFPVSVNTGSVEARLASSTIHERLARKQEFLATVLKNRDLNLRLSGKLRKQLPASGSAGSVSSLGSTGSSTVARRYHSSMRQTTKELHYRSASTETRTAARQIGMGWIRSFSERFKDIDLDTPFLVDDKVARVVAGEALVKEVGKVVEILEPGMDGEVLVEFPGETGRVAIRVDCLRPMEENAPITTQGRGECIGELALLYNVRQIAAFRAKEDTEVYVIQNHAFKECFNRESAQFREFCRLLDEVDILTPLLRAERAELARNSTGLLKFTAGEWVLRQGEEPPDQLWYVVADGSCIVTKDLVAFQETRADGVVREMTRGCHFGQDEITSRVRQSMVSVEAGPAGLSCLVFDGEVLRRLLSLMADHKGEVADCAPKQLQREMSMVELGDLKLVAVLGEGGLGSVFLARHAAREYALKRVSKGHIANQNMQRQICAERDILSLIDSPFIIQFVRSFKDAQFLYLLLEFAMGGHLYQLMSDRPQVFMQDEPRGTAAMFYAGCVTCALEHLHERSIVYRDLKPENILLDERGYAKICDLGFARFVLGKTNTMVGTPEYMSPEMIVAPHAHDTAVDWWALGVLTFELLTRQVPFNAPDCDDMMVRLVCIRKEQDAGIPDKLLPQGLVLAKEFIKRLCHVPVDRRLGSSAGGREVKRHPWFTYQKFDFEDLLSGKQKAPTIVEKKVVERNLPAISTVSQLNAADRENDLFVEYTDDGTGWDETF